MSELKKMSKDVENKFFRLKEESKNCGYKVVSISARASKGSVVGAKMNYSCIEKDWSERFKAV